MIKLVLRVRSETGGLAKGDAIGSVKKETVKSFIFKG